MFMKTKAKYKVPIVLQYLLISLLIPIFFGIYTCLLLYWQQLKIIPQVEQSTASAENVPGIVERSFGFDMEIPPTHINTYQKAAKAYNVPWTLLAAVHRVETEFSTKSDDRSTAGAEGPFQFMPCTFVGWAHPTCSGKGKGEITAKDKTSVTTIAKYGGYGIDGNGDGIANPFHFVDAAYSAAHYLAAAGATEGYYETAIYTYNHSSRYVENVTYYFTLYESYRQQLEKHAAQFE